MFLFLFLAHLKRNILNPLWCLSIYVVGTWSTDARRDASRGRGQLNNASAKFPTTNVGPWPTNNPGQLPFWAYWAPPPCPYPTQPGWAPPWQAKYAPWASSSSSATGRDPMGLRHCSRQGAAVDKQVMEDRSSRKIELVGVVGWMIEQGVGVGTRGVDLQPRPRPRGERELLWVMDEGGCWAAGVASTIGWEVWRASILMTSSLNRHLVG
ncbi:hypothetical protein E3N88_21102 [Mikania micrantha]|uniref:G-box binding protein multifunctional mosaic region domain-containing protein n=1 Tax=Mikania micrantha TaxID=192012 RepID=A0A5N6NKA3_9ASTR|nr:hypothetical protein E3N88_21102 [Mikania micrantha]